MDQGLRLALVAMPLPIIALAYMALSHPGATPVQALASPSAPPVACHVTDGDTIRCGNERVRLLGIDAPEMPGHCRIGRICAPGDPYRSSDSLAKGLAIGPVTLERVGIDVYGRTLALVSAGSVDLSCWQLRRAQAVYVAKWDDGGRLAARCPGARRRATTL